jgi:hypothetical protein
LKIFFNLFFFFSKLDFDSLILPCTLFSWKSWTVVLIADCYTPVQYPEKSRLLPFFCWLFSSDLNISRFLRHDGGGIHWLPIV